MNKRQQLSILLRILLPGVILVGIMLGSFQVSRASIKPGTSHSYVQAVVTEILTDYSGGRPFNGAQTVAARITSGVWKGQQVTLSNSNSYQQGAFCQVGTKIVAVVQSGADGSLNGSVYNYDRTGMVSPWQRCLWPGWFWWADARALPPSGHWYLLLAVWHFYTCRCSTVV